MGERAVQREALNLPSALTSMTDTAEVFKLIIIIIIQNTSYDEMRVTTSRKDLRS